MGQVCIADGKATVWHRWKRDTGKRWDSAERNVLLGLARYDLRDIYRALHGQAFDMVLQTRGLGSSSCFDP
jgi:hypothetical protein